MLILFLVQSVSLVKDNICGLDFQKQRAQNKHSFAYTPKYKQ